MVQKSQKATRYRRNRRFGEIHGGRVRPRFADNVVAHMHNLKAPDEGVELPIYMKDNPSRDFYFPVDEHDIQKVLRALPTDDVEGLTHVWLRRAKKSLYEKRELPYATFTCGSGVRLLTFFAWPRDLIVPIGPRVSQVNLQLWREWSPVVVKTKNGYGLKWDEHQVRRFYLTHLIPHEVGHHVDQYNRRWSAANETTLESFANGYAAYWSSAGIEAEVLDVETSV